MSGWIYRSVTTGLVTAIAVLGMSAPAAFAQAAGTAQSAAVPRTPDGKPDFTGMWQVLTTAWWDIQDHAAEKEVPAGLGVVEGNDIPYQPWALKQKEQNYADRATEDTVAKCNLPGVPRVTYAPYPFQIFQTPKHIGILYEYIHTSRTIYTDGSPHPAGPIDWWMGDSRGRWDGDTLVVDVIHFNDQTWFDKAGNFHSDALHVVERYTFINKDHVNYEVTIEDPKVFTRPWKMSMPLYRRIERNARILEYECYALDNPYNFISEALREQQGQ